MDIEGVICSSAMTISKNDGFPLSTGHKIPSLGSWKEPTLSTLSVNYEHVFTYIPSVTLLPSVCSE